MMVQERFSPLKALRSKREKAPAVLLWNMDGNGINDIAVTNYNAKSITIFYMDRKELLPVN